MSLAAGRLGGVDSQALVPTRAGRTVLALGAIDERNVVPKLASSDGVLKLSVGTGDDGVGIADLQRRSATIASVVSLLPLRASRDLDRRSGLVLADAEDIYVMVAAVGDNGIADGCGKTGLHGREKECVFGKHVYDETGRNDSVVSVVANDCLIWREGE